MEFRPSLSSGIFLVAFSVKHVGGTAALIAQAHILVLHFGSVDVAFLWCNLITPFIVTLCAGAIQAALDIRWR